MLVLFDVNETLSDLSALEGEFAALGARPELVRTWFAGVLRDGFALTLAGHPARFLDIAAAGLEPVLAPTLPPGTSAADAVVDVLAALRRLPPHPDVAPGLARLAADGHRVATLSNGSTDVADALLRRAGVRDVVEQVLSVEAVGAWKPDRRAYEHALTVLGVAPPETLLVAVHPWDVDGAARAGLQTAWLNRTGATWPEPFTRPGLAAADLVTLAEQLGGELGGAVAGTP